MRELREERSRCTICNPLPAKSATSNSKFHGYRKRLLSFLFIVLLISMGINWSGQHFAQEEYNQDTEPQPSSNSVPVTLNYTFTGDFVTYGRFDFGLNFASDAYSQHNLTIAPPFEVSFASSFRGAGLFFPVVHLTDVYSNTTYTIKWVNGSEFFTTENDKFILGIINTYKTPVLVSVLVEVRAVLV